MADRKNVQQSRHDDKMPADLSMTLVNLGAELTCAQMRLRGLAEITYMIHDGGEVEGEALRNTMYAVYDALWREADGLHDMNGKLSVLRAQHEATR